MSHVMSRWLVPCPRWPNNLDNSGFPGMSHVMSHWLVSCPRWPNNLDNSGFPGMSHVMSHWLVSCPRWPNNLDNPGFPGMCHVMSRWLVPCPRWCNNLVFLGCLTNLGKSHSPEVPTTQYFLSPYTISHISFWVRPLLFSALHL